MKTNQYPNELHTLQNASSTNTLFLLFSYYMQRTEYSGYGKSLGKQAIALGTRSGLGRLAGWLLYLGCTTYGRRAGGEGDGERIHCLFSPICSGSAAHDVKRIRLVREDAPAVCGLALCVLDFIRIQALSALIRLLFSKNIAKGHVLDMLELILISRPP